MYNACKLFFFPNNNNNRILTEIAKTERGIECIGQSIDAFLTDSENQNHYMKTISVKLDSILTETKEQAARIDKIEHNVALLLKNVDVRKGNNLSDELREERVAILKKRPVGEEENYSMQPATKYQCIAPEENQSLQVANPPPEEAAAAPAASGATAAAAAASGATAAASTAATSALSVAKTAAGSAPKKKASESATSAESILTTAEPRAKAAATASTKKTVPAKQKSSKVTRSAAATAGSSSVEAEGASSTQQQENTKAVSAKAPSALSLANAPTTESMPTTAATAVASLEDFISNVISSNKCTTFEKFGPKFCGHNSDSEYAISMLTDLGLYHQDFKLFLTQLYKDYVTTGKAEEETYRTVLTTRFGALLQSTEKPHPLEAGKSLTPGQIQKWAQSKQMAIQLRANHFIINISSSIYTLLSVNN